MSYFVLLVAALLGAVAISSAITTKTRLPTTRSTVPWRYKTTPTTTPSTTVWRRWFWSTTRRPSTFSDKSITTQRTSPIPMWWQRFTHRTRRPVTSTTPNWWQRHTRNSTTTSWDDRTPRDDWRIPPWDEETTTRSNDWTTPSWEEWTTPSWEDWNTPSWEDWTTPSWEDWTTPSWEDWTTRSWEDWTTRSWEDWTTRSWNDWNTPLWGDRNTPSWNDWNRRSPVWLWRLERELRQNRMQRMEMEHQVGANAERTTAVLVIVGVIAGLLLVGLVVVVVCVGMQRFRRNRPTKAHAPAYPVDLRSIHINTEPTVNSARPLVSAIVLPPKIDAYQPPTYAGVVQVDAPPQTAPIPAVVGDMSHS